MVLAAGILTNERAASVKSLASQITDARKMQPPFLRKPSLHGVKVFPPEQLLLENMHHFMVDELLSSLSVKRVEIEGKLSHL